MRKPSRKKDRSTKRERGGGDRNDNTIREKIEGKKRSTKEKQRKQQRENKRENVRNKIEEFFILMM